VSEKEIEAIRARRLAQLIVNEAREQLDEARQQRVHAQQHQIDNEMTLTRLRQLQLLVENESL
jgi:hypothetical protein